MSRLDARRPCFLLFGSVNKMLAMFLVQRGATLVRAEYSGHEPTTLPQLAKIHTAVKPIALTSLTS